MKQIIRKLVQGKDLSFEEAKEAMTMIMEGEATDAQIASFITALSMKKETIEELTACATVLREKCQRLHIEEDVLDIVGTGGDGSHTFNISTASSIVVASCGVKVAKHGNRSVSSQCGSADVLEALGVNLMVTPERNKTILSTIHLCFMFAPLYHQSMKHAAKPRKELAIPSIFNLLGPLANPACAAYQLLGVYDESLIEPMAQVLKNLGVRRGFIVCGSGLDEVSLMGETTLCDLRSDTLSAIKIDPRNLGFELCELEDLKGGDAKTNAKIIKAIFEGKLEGPKKDIVILNSGVALYSVLERKSLQMCIKMARDAIESGRANEKLKAFIKATHQEEALCF